ncbi:MAG: hypothetical protein HC838_10650 [Spirulinaceae cyanobacterium RM2_2_10]|nr:hypothetical protein [Spirulinaceae cyanobacterium RM2_2_10]
MQLTREDAYAFRRVLSKLDVPEDVKLSPVAQLLFDSLDPMNNQIGWQTLYDMVAKNHEVMQQVMYIDPKAEPPEDLKVRDELYVPPLPKDAQLDDDLIKAAEGVGRFHRECTKWLKKKSPMTPDIFLESAPLWAVGMAIARRAVLGCRSAISTQSVYPLVSTNDLLSQKHRLKGDHAVGSQCVAASAPAGDDNA